MDSYVVYSLGLHSENESPADALHRLDVEPGQLRARRVR